MKIDFDPVAEAEAAGFEMLDYSGEDAIGLKEFPFHHRDPFDRMLITQSQAREIPLMACDKNFKPYDCNQL